MKSFYVFFLGFYLHLYLVVGCPKDLIHGTNSNFCYKLVDKPESWDSANENCIELGGTLASVDGEILNKILYDASRKKLGSEKSVWLGASTDLSSNESEWLWIDDRKDTFWSGWATDEPSNKESNCLSMRLNNSKWYSKECMVPRPFICQIHKNSSDSTICPILSELPTDYNGKWFYANFTEKCYLLITTINRLNFSESRRLCQKYGADDLVVIETENENDVIAGYMSDFSANNGWNRRDDNTIGIFNNGSGWEWVDGGVPNFTKWQENADLEHTGYGLMQFGEQAYWIGGALVGQRVLRINEWRIDNRTDGGCALFTCQKNLKIKEK